MGGGTKKKNTKEIDEEREELRGIYKFHKLPVPDYIAPEIVPDVNFGSKNFYPWLDRKGGRTYAWRGSCTTLGIKTMVTKYIGSIIMLFVTLQKSNYTQKNRCDACKQGNTLKGRLFADYLKEGVFSR